VRYYSWFFDGAKDLADRLLFSFDIGERQKAPARRGDRFSEEVLNQDLTLMSNAECLQLRNLFSVGNIQDISQRLGALRGGGPTASGNGGGG